MDKYCYSRKEISEKLGLSIPMVDAFLHRINYPMPHIRAGRKVLIPATAVEQWLLDEAERSKREIG
jgi:excisionase family DNA binding protein